MLYIVIIGDIKVIEFNFKSYCKLMKKNAYASGGLTSILIIRKFCLEKYYNFDFFLFYESFLMYVYKCITNNKEMFL